MQEVSKRGAIERRREIAVYQNDSFSSESTETMSALARAIEGARGLPCSPAPPFLALHHGLSARRRSAPRDDDDDEADA